MQSHIFFGGFSSLFVRDMVLWTDGFWGLLGLLSVPLVGLSGIGGPVDWARVFFNCSALRSIARGDESPLPLETPVRLEYAGSVASSRSGAAVFSLGMSGLERFAAMLADCRVPGIVVFASSL